MYKISKSDTRHRAWNILRLALLWARKGGVFALKKRVMQLSRSHFLHSDKTRGALQDGDRQLSFDATPMIHVRMHRPNSMRFHIPCINPQADVVDFDDRISQSDYSYDRRSFQIDEGRDREQIRDEDQGDGIDLKAEEFIANFYDQLKLQRQISYLQYNNNK